MAKEKKQLTNEDLIEKVGISSPQFVELMNTLNNASDHKDFITTTIDEKIFNSENWVVNDSKNITEEDFRTKIEIVNKSQFQDENYPCYAKGGDSGFDLKADIEEYIILQPLQRKLVPTGIYVNLPPFTEIQVRPKSGVSTNKGMMVAFGTVDQGYTGEILVTCFNLTNYEMKISKGEKIAQCVVAPVMNSQLVNLVKVDKIERETERGETGFGSSGKF